MIQFNKIVNIVYSINWKVILPWSSH